MDKKEKVLLLLLAVVQFCHIVDFMVLMPLGPTLLRLFKIGTQEFGMLISIYTLAAAIMNIVGAFFLDRMDRKKALQVFFVGFILGTLMCALSESYIMLLIARGLTGAFGGLVNSTVLSIVADNFAVEKRGRAMGFIMTTFSVASIVGVPFSLWLAGLFKWEAPFYFLVGLSLLALIILSFYLSPQRKHLQNQVKTSPFLPFKEALFDTNQSFALLFMFFLMLGHFMIIPFLSPVMVGNFGIAEKHLPLIYLFGGGANFFATPMIGKWVDKKGRLPVFITFLFLSFIPVFALTHLGQTSLFIALLFTTLLFITSSGRMVPAMDISASAVIMQKRGSFMGISMALQHLAITIGTSVAGYIIFVEPSGRMQNFQIVGYMSMGFVLLSLFFGRRVKVRG
ncbi:MAG: MFS transporter [Bacteriovoracaceae bacterium]|nr:MFS transporter [Bacteriovoracaceae bacterium]